MSKLDRESMKKRLEQLKSSNKRQSSLWKPKEGENIIRIVPNLQNLENPFIELEFYYNLGPKNYLSPSCIGEADPVKDFINENLYNTDNKEDYKLAKSLEPTMRTYLPIVVRGEEKKGIKYWGFGKTIYQQLLSYFTNPRYGDLSDPKNGMDIIVTYTPKEKSDTEYAQTTIMIDPQRTPLVETKEEFKELMETRKDIFEVYKPPTYEDLDVAFRKKLGDDVREDESSESTTADSNSNKNDDEKPKNKQKEKETEGKKSSSEALEDIDDVENEFEKMYEDFDN